MKNWIKAAVLASAVLVPTAFSQAEPLDVKDWSSIVSTAQGQNVYFHAWGGDDRINDYIAWAGAQVKDKYGVTVTHVKVTDTANVVSTVLSEKTAGNVDKGSVDLVWINGENFAAMKRNEMLLPSSWSTDLPSYRYADVENKPTLTTDFTVPVDGLQAPWGMAKMVFFYDSTTVKNPPLSAENLALWAAENPGRFTYPLLPDFIGTSFIKQLMIDLAEDASIFQKEADTETFASVTAPLWAYLDELHPNLWRSGRAFPQNFPAMRQLLADSEIDIYFAFNPADASTAIAAGELPGSIKPFVFEEGTLANTHFVAVPFNASAKAGAMVLANFLLSPEAQAHKQDPNVWGDPTVLSTDKLEDADKALFSELDLGVATPSPAEMGKALDEPHPSWVSLLEAEWAKRYSAQ